MSLVITTDDYERIAQELIECGAEKDAQLMYEFYGPFELSFDSDEEPDWYKGAVSE